MQCQQKLLPLLGQLKLPSPVSQIRLAILKEKNIELFIKRDELIHPIIQGNKWRKLKYNLCLAFEQQKKTILSFGGAYSNHLHALAASGKQLNIKTIGIIRGEAPHPLNSCLQDMSDWGMQLEFISRKDFKLKNKPEFIQQLHEKLGDFYLIPEGGNNSLGIKGCSELLDELQQDFDFICCEVGSGTMLSSLIAYNKKQQTHFLGFAVMKNPALEQEIIHNIPIHTHTQWSINHDYHFSGFAKTNAELNAFIENFKQQFDIQLEPVYSGKMLYGLLDLIRKNHFKAGSKILAIHGGGLQGLRGFPQIKHI